MIINENLKVGDRVKIKQRPLSEPDLFKKTYVIEHIYKNSCKIKREIKGPMIFIEYQEMDNLEKIQQEVSE